MVQSRSAQTARCLNKTSTITSADSLTQTVTTDSNGDGVIDLKITDTLSLACRWQADGNGDDDER